MNTFSFVKTASKNKQHTPKEKTLQNKMERKNKIYHCQVCKESFENEGALRDHNRRAHPNIVLIVKNLKN